MKKQFISSNNLLLDSFRLGKKIEASGFKPDFLVGLWRGGTGVGIAVQECLDFLGIQTDHISVRTSYAGLTNYRKMIKNPHSIRVHGLKYLYERAKKQHSILLVDDVFSSGTSVNAVIEKLKDRTSKQFPCDIRIATVFYRPNQEKKSKPDFFIHQTKDWLVLPYELCGISIKQLRNHKKEILPVINQIEERLKKSEAIKN
tara:strand:+ start:189 stop:791 length:603 start_codon:yes stop_codon:yes gene_type:complete